MVVVVVPADSVAGVEKGQRGEREPENDRRCALDPDPHAVLGERAISATTTASRIAGR